MIVSKQPGFRVEAIKVDVTLQESVDLAFKNMVDCFKRIDHCVTCPDVCFDSLLTFIVH
jgi:NAD(P)-dependent dehydrogenase (short-subunit alcohol dehydrogenase family)